MPKDRSTRPSRLKDLGKRCEVFAWIAPKHLVEISQERTKGMVSYFLEVSRGLHWLKAIELLDNLAQSCYMQGVNDTISAEVQRLQGNSVTTSETTQE